jgi:tetratricopeptide (TPR) repeat protein
MDWGAWHDSDQIARQAQALMRQQRWAEALRELERACAIDPWNLACVFELGSVLDALGRRDDAIVAYREALRIDPEHVPSMAALARDLHQAGDSEEALELLDRAGAIDDVFEPVHCTRVELLVEIGEHNQAEEAFYLARQTTEHCSRCYAAIGRSLAARSLHRQAVACYVRAIEPGRTDAGLSCAAGESLLALGKLDDARVRFAEALAVDAACALAHRGMIEVLLKLGRPAEALARSHAAATLLPADPRLQASHARALVECRRFDEAREALNRAISCDPTLAGAHLQLAQLAARLAQRDTALHHLRAELLLGPKAPETLTNVGMLLLDLGEANGAAACFRRIVEMHFDDADAWQNLGVAEAEARHDPHAIAAFRRVVELAPARPAGWFNLALAFADGGQFDEAQRTITAGVLACHDDRLLRILRARLRVRRVMLLLRKPFEWLAGAS